MRRIYRKINTLYLIIRDFVNRDKKRIHIYDTEKSLSLIYKKKLSVARFGDGEFDLIALEDLGFQEADLKLKEDLMRVLNNESNNKNCLIGIPYTFATLKKVNLKSKLFWLKYYAKKRDQLMQALNPNIQYIDSQITRIYINRKNKAESDLYFSIWKKIWDKKDILLVEGELTRFAVGNDLLSNARSVRRILCPAKNAYAYIDEIKERVLSQNDYNLVILILGPTATILAYDLSMHGIQVIDCGNLDMEYEWMKKESKTQTALPEKYTVEAEGGTEVANCNDELYLSQIIGKIEVDGSHAAF